MISIASKRAPDAAPGASVGAVARSTAPSGKDALELKESRLTSLYAKALEMQVKQNFSEAVALYVQMLASDLFHPDSGVSGSQTAADKVKLSTQSLKLKYLALKNLGELQASLGENSAALQNLLLAIDIDDTDVMVLGRLGRLASEELEVSLALKVLARALSLQPNYWPALENYAIALYAVGDYEQCSEFVQHKALAIDRNWIQGHLLMQMCQFKTNPKFFSNNAHTTTSALIPDLTDISEARRLVLTAIDALPPDFLAIPREDVMILIENMNRRENLALGSLGRTIETTPAKLSFTSSSAFHSPPAVSTPTSSHSSVGFFSTPTNYGNVTVALPPTLMLGLQRPNTSSMVENMASDSAYMMVDGEDGTLAPNTEHEEDFSNLVSDLCDTAVKWERMRISVSTGEKYAQARRLANPELLDASEQGTPLQNFAMNGPDLFAVVVELDKSRLTLDELISLLFKQTETLASCTDTDLALRSPLNFTFADEPITEEIVNRYAAQVEGLASSRLTGAKKGAKTPVLRSTPSNLPKRTASQLKGVTKTSSTIRNRKSSENANYSSEDEADFEKTQLSRHSSNLGPSPSDKTSKDTKNPEDMDEEEIEPQATAAEDAQKIREISSSPAPAAPITPSSRLPTSDTTTKVNSFLCQDTLPTFIARAVSNITSDALISKQDIAAKLLPFDSVQHAIKTHAHLQLNTPTIATTVNTQNAPGVAFRKLFEHPLEEALHVLKLVFGYLDGMTLPQALHLVVAHVCHLYYDGEWRKNIVLRLRKALPLLSRLSPGDNLYSGVPKEMLDLQTIEDTEEEKDTLPLPYTELFSAESALANERLELIPSYTRSMRTLMPPLLVLHSHDSQPQNHSAHRRKEAQSPLTIVDFANLHQGSLQDVDLSEEASTTHGRILDCIYKKADAQRLASGELEWQQVTAIQAQSLTLRETTFYLRSFWLELAYVLNELSQDEESTDTTLNPADFDAAQYCIHAVKVLHDRLSHTMPHLSGDKSSPSTLAKIHLPHLPRQWQVVDDSNIDAKLNLLQRLKNKYELEMRATLEKQQRIALMESALAAASASKEGQIVDPSQIAASASSVSGPTSAPQVDMTITGTPLSQATGAASTAAPPQPATAETVLSEYLSENMTLASAISKKKYLRCLKRIYEHFHVSGGVSFHSIAHLIRVDSHPSWRTKVVDALDHTSASAIDAIDTLAKAEQTTAVDFLQTPEKLESASTNLSVHSCVIITQTLYLLLQALRLEVAAAVAPMPADSGTLPRATLLNSVTRLLSHPSTRRLSYLSLIYEHQMANEAALNDKNGTATPGQSPSPAQPSSPKPIEFQADQVKLFQVFSSCTSTLLSEIFAPLLCSNPTFGNKKRNRNKYADLAIAFFWTLRSIPTPGLVNTELLLDFLWVAHTDLANCDGCHSSDGCLLHTSIRFVTEMEDVLEEVYKSESRRRLQSSSTPQSSVSKLFNLARMMNPADQTHELSSFTNARSEDFLAPHLLQFLPVELYHFLKQSSTSVSSQRAGSQEEKASAETTAIGTALLCPSNFSTLSVTPMSSYRISLKRHELLHRCICCLYGLEIPLPKWKDLEDNVCARPHRQTGGRPGGSTFSGFSGSGSNVTVVNSLTGTLCSAKDIQGAAETATKSAILASVQAELLWRIAANGAGEKERASVMEAEREARRVARRQEKVDAKKRRIERRREKREAFKAKHKPAEGARRSTRVRTATTMDDDDGEDDDTDESAETPGGVKSGKDDANQSDDESIDSEDSRILEELGLEYKHGKIGCGYGFLAEEESNSSASKPRAASTSATAEKNQKEESERSEKRAQRFLLHHLHALPGSANTRSVMDRYIEDMFHVYRYTEKLLLMEKNRPRQLPRVQELISRVHLIFGDGPFLQADQTNVQTCTNAVDAVSSWLQTNSFDVENVGSFPSYLSSGTPSPVQASSMDVDHQQGGDSRQKLWLDVEDEHLPMSLCSSSQARHRYSIVYDNISYLKALTKLQDTTTLFARSGLVRLLQIQLFSRPFHLLSLVELAHQYHAMMLSRTSTIGVYNMQAAALNAADDGANVVPVNLFFGAVRCLLMAAKLHKELVHDRASKDASERAELVKVARRKEEWKKVAEKFVSQSACMALLRFEGDDPTLLVSIRKQLIVTLWRGAKHFQREDMKIGCLRTAKALASQWIASDSSIGSPSAYQSGLWLIPFLKGRIQEDLISILLPLPKKRHGNGGTNVASSLLFQPPPWVVSFPEEQNPTPQEKSTDQGSKRPKATSSQSSITSFFSPTNAKAKPKQYQISTQILDWIAPVEKRSIGSLLNNVSSLSAPQAFPIAISQHQNASAMDLDVSTTSGTDAEVEQWMFHLIQEYEEVLEDYERAIARTSSSAPSLASSALLATSHPSTSSATLNPAQNPSLASSVVRTLPVEPRFRIQCARLSVLALLYDPLIGPRLSDEFKMALLEMLDQFSVPSGVCQPLLTCTSPLVYLRSGTPSSNTTLYEPIEHSLAQITGHFVPPVCALPAKPFFDSLSAASPSSHADAITIKMENILDNILDGLRECVEAKKGIKFHKAYFKIAQILSGVDAQVNDVHRLTQGVLKTVVGQANAKALTAKNAGRIVDRNAALEWMSLLINFKGLPPKLQLWTFFLDDVPEIAKPDSVGLLQIKYLELTLSILSQLCDDYLPGLFAIPVANDAINTAGASNTAEAAPATLAASRPVRAVTQAPAVAIPVSTAPNLSSKIWAYLALYLENLMDKISNDRAVSGELLRLLAELALPIARKLVMPLYEELLYLSLVAQSEENGAQTGAVPARLAFGSAPQQYDQTIAMSVMEHTHTSCLVQMLKTAALLWKLVSRLSLSSLTTASLRLLALSFSLYRGESMFEELSLSSMEGEALLSASQSTASLASQLSPLLPEIGKITSLEGIPDTAVPTSTLPTSTMST